LFGAGFSRVKDFPGPGQGIAFYQEQVLYLAYGFQVFPGVAPVAAGKAYGPYQAEFAFPLSYGMFRYVHLAGNFAYGEVIFFHSGNSYMEFKSFFDGLNLTFFLIPVMTFSLVLGFLRTLGIFSLGVKVPKEEITTLSLLRSACVIISKMR